MSDPLTDLKTLPPDVFASRWIFENVPHVFGGNLQGYVDWKTHLAKGLIVDPRAITLVGSASVGVSLSPNKIGKAFHDSSDIDVAVISHRFFETAWHFLRDPGVYQLRMTPASLAALSKHSHSKVFYGEIATDRILGYLPFAKPWLSALSAMSRVAPTLGRDVKVRIYRDFESLRQYQLLGVTNAQASMSP